MESEQNISMLPISAGPALPHESASQSGETFSGSHIHGLGYPRWTMRIVGLILALALGFYVFSLGSCVLLLSGETEGANIFVGGLIVKEGVLLLLWLAVAKMFWQRHRLFPLCFAAAFLVDWLLNDIMLWILMKLPVPEHYAIGLAFQESLWEDAVAGSWLLWGGMFLLDWAPIVLGLYVWRSRKLRAVFAG